MKRKVQKSKQLSIYTSKPSFLNPLQSVGEAAALKYPTAISGLRFTSTHRKYMKPIKSCNEIFHDCFPYGSDCVGQAINLNYHAANYTRLMLWYSRCKFCKPDFNALGLTARLCLLFTIRNQYLLIETGPACPSDSRFERHGRGVMAEGSWQRGRIWT